MRPTRAPQSLAFSTESPPVCCSPRVKIPICAPVFLILMGWPGQILWAQSLQLEGHGEQTRTSASMLAAAKLAEQQLTQQLRTAIARGRVRNTVYERDLESPVVTLDADVQVYYDAPKYLLWMQYASAAAGAPADTPTGEPSSDAVQQPLNGKDQVGRIASQIVLFDGQTLTTVRHSDDGTCRGDIYFNFHLSNQLRSAGFPFQNPIELWHDPLAIDRADLVQAQATPMTNGGWVGQLVKDTYRLKFYFLGSFGYDLRRVSFYAAGQETPFRDWHLTWQQTAGVHYVQRLVRRVNTLAAKNEPLGTSSIVRAESELEYTQFELPPSIEPNVFELSNLDLPESTPFHDHRAHVDGKPKVVWWRQGELHAQP